MEGGGEALLTKDDAAVTCLDFQVANWIYTGRVLIVFTITAVERDIPCSQRHE